MRFQAGLLKYFVLYSIVFLMTAASLFAQSPTNSPATDNQVIIVSEVPPPPPIIQHLPDWKKVQEQAVYINTAEGLHKALGNRPVFNSLSFEGGTEAATANYPAGKLLIVEYPTPQFSIDVDNRVKQFVAENPSSPPVYFRRVGNYEVFVFDSEDESAANELIDQVKYEKIVQWLGEDPFLYQKAERAQIKSTGELFVSTILSILLGLSFAICTGAAIGIFVFYLRKQRRASMTAFSDAGGMTRLNLDELSADRVRLLKD